MSGGGFDESLAAFKAANGYRSIDSVAWIDRIARHFWDASLESSNASDLALSLDATRSRERELRSQASALVEALEGVVRYAAPFGPSDAVERASSLLSSLPRPASRAEKT